MDPKRGLYDGIITEALKSALLTVADRMTVGEVRLSPAEAADRIALHVANVLKRTVAGLSDEARVNVGIELARSIIETIARNDTKHPVDGERPALPAMVLRQLLGKRPDGEPEEILEPLTPLLDTTLLTNSPGEPRIGSQVCAEIPSADGIDAVIAFIRMTGVSPLLKALELHCSANRSLRFVTTTYTGSTEAKALDALEKVGAQIRVSYIEDTTRLHAKAWLFHRETGYSTAFIGSSNLTFSAQVTGLEWNVRVSQARNPDVVGKMSAVFESYWNSPDFVPYDRDEFLARTKKVENELTTFVMSPTELRPEPFQERLLEQIALARLNGQHRNLLVAATGTGKTVMAALDYARLKETLVRSRLLFVAHRYEILEQALGTFRHCLRNPSFGELWVGGERPREFQHVFASIQSLQASGPEKIDPNHFDVVIVDEFHHAAAASYQALLHHLTPIELLGCTATPERSDGLPLIELFGGRIAAELRLWDAIDQQRLVPFLYFGVHDGLDLSKIPWKRGQGYDVEGLTTLLTSSDAWVRVVLNELTSRVNSTTQMRALGFCVSVAHAQFMARVFGEAGILAVAISAATSDVLRKQALEDLAARRVNVVFSVDLFNEGVDIPTVDTLLLLRPTESATLFIQQLGRGLRKTKGKSACTVLDFVGHHRMEFRFDLKLRALLGGTRKDVEEQVTAGFPYLPSGCHMELDAVASKIVLDSLKRAIPSRWNEKIGELRTFATGKSEVTLAAFLAHSGLELDHIYAGDSRDGTKGSWSAMLEAAGLPVLVAGPHEVPLRRACGRLSHVDDRDRIDAYQALLSSATAPKVNSLSNRQLRLLRMLVASLGSQVFESTASLQQGCELLWQHPQVLYEASQVLEVGRSTMTHLPLLLSSHPEVSLAVHAQYSRLEILGAFGVGSGASTPSWREGVYFAKEEKADILAFTLDKTSGHFSPTTRYRDYAISRDLIHWESQGRTPANGPIGTRYRNHVAMGSSVMLFAQLRSGEAYYFLGPATYVSHVGERPMAITWKLQHPLPGDLFASFAVAVA